MYTIGRIAFEASTGIEYNVDGTPKRASRWDALDETTRAMWERVGQAVLSFYETGIPGRR
jgi:hypothetical protein